MTQHINNFYYLMFLLVCSLTFWAGVAAMIVSEEMEKLLEYPLTALMFFVLIALFGKYHEIFAQKK